MKQFFALLITLTFSALVLAQAPADLVLVNGKIWTMDDKRPEVEAVAVLGNRIAAVGSTEEIRKWIGANTKVIDLQGKRVTPGFNDSHVHFLDGGMGLASVQLRDARTPEEFRDRIRDFAAKLPKGRWTLNGNWDHENWTPPALPTRRLIDAVTPDHPVFVNRLDGHMCLANSLALKLAGVTRETRDVPGGTIVRDAAGEPTGVLKDNAQELVTRVIPEPTREMNLRAARAALREAARFGVTSIHDNSSADALPTYQDLRAAGELTARLNVWRYIAALPALKQAGVRSGLGDDWIRLGPIKILSDG